MRISDSLQAALAARYRIGRELGAGGMATVYLAYDVKHDRCVALKVLRRELGLVLGGERFLREIRTTAQLQHPHLLPLLDSGEADGLLYYAMPYVEGETLRARISRETQLPVAEAIRLATEVASALDYAHRHGVVHRDIKPENILLHDGAALVADFGIAVMLSAAGGERITETGVSVGTPQYMSPEQAAGERQITSATDVYALGCVLYEMLAGEPPFTGPTAQVVVARAASEAPRPLVAQRHSIPRHVEAAVLRALEKLPADRFESARVFAEALTTPTSAPPEPDAGGGRRATAAIVGLAGVAVVAAALAVWGWWRPPPQAGDQFTTVFDLDTRPYTPAFANGPLFDVSPDASMIVFVGADSAGVQRLYLRGADSTGVVPIPGTDGALTPEFSPDGQWIAYVQGNDLKKIAVAGGEPLVVAHGAVPFGLMWGAGDTIVFCQPQLAVVSAGGGTLREIPTAGDTVAMRWPFLLPDGRHALVTEMPTLAEARIAVVDLQTGERKVVLQQATNARYVAPGYLVYGHPYGGVFAVPFSLSRRRVTGAPVQIIDGVAVMPSGSLRFAVSARGGAVFMRWAPPGTHMAFADRDGSAKPTSTGIVGPGTPRFSPDGRRVAYEAWKDGGGMDIEVYDRVQHTVSQITFTGRSQRPVWSPDGAWLYYSGERPGSDGYDIYRRRSDGTGPEEALLVQPLDQWMQDVGRDGTIVIMEATARNGTDVMVRSPSDSRFRAFLANPWDEQDARLSPDGRWLAYASNESGAKEIYVTSFPGAVGKWQVSQGGGTQPAWAPDGLSLYYFSKGDLMVARLAGGTTFAIRTRARAIEDAARHNAIVGYDLSPDGRAFVLNEQDATDGVPPYGIITVAVNWSAELRRRMAGRR